MELVYLWVKEYKNIHRQGFNFSPRFNCHYDEDSNELTIDENDGYIENFFDENINVTAIVGKNGSGKSSLREIFEDIFISISLDENLGYIFAFIANGKKCYIENIGVFCKDNFTEVDSIPSSLLTYVAEMPYPYFESNHIKFSNNYTISFENSAIVEKIARYLNDTFKLTTFMLIPKKIYIEQNKDFLDKLINDIRPSVIPRSNKPDNGVPLEDCHDEREEYNTDSILEAFMFERIVENDLAYYLCKKNFYNPKSSEYDSVVLETFFNDEEYGLNEEEYSLKEFNSLLEKKFFDKDTLTEDDNKLIQKYSKFLNFDFEDARGRKYNDLSHGEKSIFGQFLSIYDKLNNIDRNLLIYLDEPDLSLHPNWQKKYLNELSNTFFDSDKNMHFVLTTHSPFLLSDILKQNIIFLDTYKEDDSDIEDNKQKAGNCKVLKHDEVMNKQQTFGQNIHTLLSDSFFMDEGGLMGEFAKRKINKIIEYLRDDSENKSFVEDMPKYDNWLYDKENLKKIIDAIGEPFLRHKILELYYDKFTGDATEAERKKELLKQKERIERELSRYD